MARRPRAGGKYVAHLEHWPIEPAGARLVHLLSARSVHHSGRPGRRSRGLLKFAGEHADSFYSWQGFMEGACLSGIRAANEMLDDIKTGAL